MKAIWILILALFVLFANAAIRKDIVPRVPGYSDSFKTQVYAGYLNTTDEARKIHYVFVQAASGVNNTDAVTLWLNGGPGCSSLLGFLQQIGPFYLQQGANYKPGQKLTQNPYSWHKVSNLLFIQSPAGVGYSINKDPQFKYNDLTTANDNFNSLLNFFTNYPQYSKNNFFIAGQSYAGKYIPDLAVLIDGHNAKQNVVKINLKGILVGNGVMNFRNSQLEKSQDQFMVDHDFIDPEIIPYYQRACMNDQNSAGCHYFKKKFDQNVEEINPYNIYSYCYYNSTAPTIEQNGQAKLFHSQQSILKQFARNQKFSSSGKLQSSVNKKSRYNGAPCAFFDGLYSYFNAHISDYNAKDSPAWNGPCADKISQIYTIDQGGSMFAYQQLLGDYLKYHIIFYNGDWDDVVPFTDTIKNMQKLKLVESYLYTPYFVNDQHAGFIQLYSGVTFVIFKGASHQVPQSKRAQSFDFFKTAIESHGSQQLFKQMILNR